MFNLVLGIGIILVLFILFMLFRIGTMVSIIRKKKDEDESKGSDSLNGALFLIFLIVGFTLFFWYSYTYFDDYTQPVASEHGVLTDRLFWITMGVTGVVFIITNILLFYFSFAYQHKEGRKAKFYPDNTKLELMWTVVPAIVLSVLVFTGLQAWNDITSEASADAEVVEIMGYQFAWGVRYPGVKDNALGDYHYQLIDASNQFGMDLTDDNAYDDFMPREIHIPKGKEILFKIRARDVLHSVYAPHFRLKMDAVPGMPTHFKFTATKTTEEMRAELNNPDFNYEIACAEVCGRGHFSMKMIVVVEEQEAFEKWKAEQVPWLRLNAEYLDRVPEDKKELAMIKAGIETDQKQTLEASL